MGLFSSLLDLYENMRKTETKVKNTKTTRNYDFDGGFTGNKKIDCPVYKPSDKNKEKNKIEEKETEGR